MAIIKFFKVPRHKQFEYKTRFWDPQKEEMEERLRQAEERRKFGVEGSKARIVSGFRAKTNYTGYGNLRRRQTARSNLMLVAFVIILLFLTYMLLTEYLPRLLQLVD